MVLELLFGFVRLAESVATRGNRLDEVGGPARGSLVLGGLPLREHDHGGDAAHHDQNHQNPQPDHHRTATLRLRSPHVNAMSTRVRNLLFLAGIVGIGVLGFFLAGGGTPPSALDAIPAQSFLVATLDLDAIRASPFGDRLAALDEGGMQEVKQRCGFDPLARAKELAVAVPEEEAPGEFGVVARGDLGTEDIARCASLLAEARGGKTRVVESNGFTIVEDDSRERTISRIALRPGGPIVVGSGKWLDTIMDVVRTGKGSVRGDDAHTSLRKAVSDGSPAIVITAILPKKLRERIKRELEDEPKESEAATAMAGVLGVSQAGLSIDPGRKGTTATIAIELRCERDDECDAVEKLVDRKRRAAASDIRLRLAGIGVLLDEIKLERKGAVLRATLVHDAEDLAQILGRVLESKPFTPGKPRLDGGLGEQ